MNVASPPTTQNSLASHRSGGGPVILSLFSGIGMLDEAVRLVFPRARTAAFCEWESFAATVLLARMEDASLESAPVWCGDLRDLDGRPFRGLVDILAAGPPCQPYSPAGKRAGLDDERSVGADGHGPITQLLRLIGEVRPALVFFENVPAWVRGLRIRGERQYPFKTVGEELCRMGYQIVEPVFLAAADVKASHERERVFILAYRLDAPGSAELKQQCRQWADLARSSSGQLENAPLVGTGQIPARPGDERTGTTDPERRSGQLAHPECPERRPETGPGICGDERENAGRETAGRTGEQSGTVGDTECGGFGERGRATAKKFGERCEPMGEPHRQPEQQPHHSESTHPRRDARGSSGRPSSGVEPASLAPGVGLADAGGEGQQRRELRSPSGEWHRPQTSGSTPELREIHVQPGPEGSPQDMHGVRTSIDREPGELSGISMPKLRDDHRHVCAGDLPLFAPGPGDLDLWPAIVTDEQGLGGALTPAIKPGLRVLVDGLALVVDESRTDQLRCTGNGVVALCAAVALVELLRRADLK